MSLKRPKPPIKGGSAPEEEEEEEEEEDEEEEEEEEGGGGGSLPRSQVPATCTYPEPPRSSPTPHVPLPEDPS